MYARILGEGSFGTYDYANTGQGIVLSDLIARLILSIVTVSNEVVT